MKERAALSDRLRSFGPVTSRELLQNTSATGGSRCARTWLEERHNYHNYWETGLCFLGVPFEVWIMNDALTFNTAHHAGPLFLLRDGVGNHATVRAGAGRALSGSLRCLSCFFEVHGAPPCGEKAFQYIFASMNLLHPQKQDRKSGKICSPPADTERRT